MVVNELPRVILVIPVQLSKALSPIVVTVLGTVTLVMPLHFLKVQLSMAVTV